MSRLDAQVVAGGWGKDQKNRLPSGSVPRKSGMTMAWFHVLDSLLSSVRKVAALSCPQYRGAENACQEAVSSSHTRQRSSGLAPL